LQTQPKALTALAKFSDPNWTAKGEARATVAFDGAKTLWFNTGTLCNIACAGCYIESTPHNNRLSYLTPADIAPFLDELAARGEQGAEIGFTGGEPFLNPHCCDLIAMALQRGHPVLVLTNAMRPMMRPRVQRDLADLIARFGARLTLRVSLDHPEASHHDTERGGGAFEEAAGGLDWLAAQGARLAIAGRLWGENEQPLRIQFAALFAQRGWPIDAHNPTQMVLFPEMSMQADPPEISTGCWGILGKRPGDVMCASSRMVVKRAEADQPAVLACTLIAYDERFELGATLAQADRPVALNHPHCATFCVLGGASCSAKAT
jgi:uncharacterized Fe-S cluster-containing radical SAM superfamily protein